MSLRNLALSLAITALSAVSFARNKQELPDLVLQAHTVLVVVDPDATSSPGNPNENEMARQAVEQALMKWGRFTFATGANTADLVITVQKGHSGNVSPTMGRGNTTGPVVMNPGPGGVMIGGRQGVPPPLTSDPTVDPQSTGPRAGTQVGQSQDELKVYRGGVDTPLDGAPLWRYDGRNGFTEPSVNAVAEFRKAVERSEQANAKKP